MSDLFHDPVRAKRQVKKDGSIVVHQTLKGTDYGPTCLLPRKPTVSRGSDKLRVTAAKVSTYHRGPPQEVVRPSTARVPTQNAAARSELIGTLPFKQQLRWRHEKPKAVPVPKEKAAAKVQKVAEEKISTWDSIDMQMKSVWHDIHAMSLLRHEQPQQNPHQTIEEEKEEIEVHDEKNGILVHQPLSAVDGLPMGIKFRSALQRKLKELQRDETKRNRLQLHVREIQAERDALLEARRPSRPMSARTPRNTESTNTRCFHPLGDFFNEPHTVEVRQRKEQNELDLMQKCLWDQNKWEHNCLVFEQKQEAATLAPVRDEWRKWILAFVVYPRRIRLMRKIERKRLNQNSKDDIVQLFAQKMMNVVHRRRARRARVRMIVARAIGMWVCFYANIRRKRLSIYLIIGALRSNLKKKPTMYFIHRYYVKIRKCQNIVRNFVATKRARTAWTLIRLLQYELRLKGSGGNRVTNVKFPVDVRGKSPEWMANRCATLVSKKLTVPLELKLPFIHQYWAQWGKKHLKATVAYHQQRETIAQYAREIRSSVEVAEKTIFKHEARLFRSFLPLIIPDEGLQIIYAAAQKKFVKHLAGEFLRLRQTHSYLTLANYVDSVFHLNVVHDAKLAVEAEKKLILTLSHSWLFSPAAHGEEEPAGVRSLEFAALTQSTAGGNRDLGMAIRFYLKWMGLKKVNT